MDALFDSKHTEEEISSIREREEEDVAQILSQKYGIAYVDLSSQEIDNEALRVIPEEEARAAEAVAFAKNAKTISLAVHNPNNPALLKLKDGLVAREFTLNEFLVSKKSFLASLRNDNSDFEAFPGDRRVAPTIYFANFASLR